jgi:hypothetical protein
MNQIHYIELKTDSFLKWIGLTVLWQARTPKLKFLYFSGIGIKNLEKKFEPLDSSKSLKAIKSIIQHVKEASKHNNNDRH